MTTFTLSTVRANQKSAIGLSNGSFNGNISVSMGIVDAKKLTFNANVTFETGDTAHPTYTFSPCSDDGEYKKFSAIDDMLAWVNNAFYDVKQVEITIANIDLAAKVEPVPTDPVADALKQKVKFQKLKDGIADNKTKAITAVTAAAASGWNLPTKSAALQANYAELVAKRDVVLGIEAYYTDRVTHFAAIV